MGRVGRDIRGDRLQAAILGGQGGARDFYDHYLQAQAEPQVRYSFRAGEVGCLDLSLGATLTKAAGHDDAVEAGEGTEVAVLEQLGVDPADVDGDVVMDAGVDGGLFDGE